MQSIKKFAQDIGAMEMLNNVTKIYEEVYAIKMQNVRQGILSNRSFFEELHLIFSDVKATYFSFAKKVRSVKKKKMAVVLLTANKKFSGDINQKVFYDFYDFIKQNECDAVISGNVGKVMYIQKGRIRPFSYFERPEGSYTAEDLLSLVEHLNQYETVVVFYGKFVNLVSQKAEKRNISGSSLVLEGSSHTDKPSSYYMFEPSVTEIYNFFQTQLFAYFFKQATQESFLADLGSRVSEMEKSSYSIDLVLKDMKNQYRQVSKRELNKKQLKSLAGISFWT